MKPIPRPAYNSEIRGFYWERKNKYMKELIQEKTMKNSENLPDDLRVCAFEIKDRIAQLKNASENFIHVVQKYKDFDQLYRFKTILPLHLFLIAGKIDHLDKEINESFEDEQ